MDLLIKELKKDSPQFKSGYRSGMPAGSKKYKYLLKFITRETKKESGQDQDHDLDIESSVMSFQSVHGPNHDTASIYFGNEDLPPVSQSQIVSSFQDAERKTNDLTHSISDLQISPSPEDKKESQSLAANPFLKMMSFEEES